MVTARKHPARYGREWYDLMEEAIGAYKPISRLFETYEQARQFRVQLYAAREALARHPEYDPSLAKHSFKLRFKLKRKPDTMQVWVVLGRK